MLLSLFMGVMLPLAIIYSDPTEFTNISTFPIELVINNWSIFAGYFIFWFGIYYYFSGTKGRNVFTLIVWILVGVFLVNYLFFAGDYGIMSNSFVFDTTPTFTTIEILINLLIVVALIVALIFVFKKFRKAILYVYAVLLISCIGFSCFYAINIAHSLREPESAAETTAIESDNHYVDSLTLSKNGQNVVVFVIDKAMGGFVPYIFNEKKELAEQFSGFVYYPNTLSYGIVTKWGAPALYGGYEYSPLNLNLRSDEYLVDKHNEALTVMPAIFSKNGYDVTVWGSVLAGYGDPDKASSLYDFDENIKEYEISDEYVNTCKERYGTQNGKNRTNNLFFYSVFRVVPVCMRSAIYNDGSYLHTAQIIYSDEFLSNYSSLNAMTEITEVATDTDFSFLMLYNALPHTPAYLESPEYKPKENASSPSKETVKKEVEGNNGRILYINKKQQVATFDSNMATYVLIGKWLEHLKKEGVYDNTKIIIASDHGAWLECLLENSELKGNTDIECLNCVLMIKDYNSTGAFRVSDELMLNADVPWLAMEDNIEDSTNPYSGNLIESNEIEKESAIYTYVDDFALSLTEKIYDTSLGTLWEFRGKNIYDSQSSQSWSKVE